MTMHSVRPVTVVFLMLVVLGFIGFVSALAPGTIPNVDGVLFPNPTKITNPYLPLKPGTEYTYAGTSDGVPETSIVTVTHDTRIILGVTTVVVRDKVYQDGDLVEDTFDWYAQDSNGNVWYFGEDSTELENGKVLGHEGSWKAGVKGARPGIVMEASPQVWDMYNQENAFPDALDMAQVMSLTESVTVPYKSFAGNVLMTQDFTPLEPGVIEHKFYAPDIGLVKDVLFRGGTGVSQLISIKTGL
ncbi:MAG: hypothetical protein LUQ40_00130 [Methanomicrobiales archaeon]|nr:hypothetical protein [Methanomicrobiales archaeon]